MQSAQANGFAAGNGRPKVSIALMGGTGTGKTTFVNLIGGAEFRVGNDLESCTDQVQLHNFEFEGYDVTLVDMPGFDDTSKSDSDILRMIAEFLASQYRAKKTLHGVLYLHRISDVRMGGSSKRNFIMFQKLCGSAAFTNVAIVTTRWDIEEPEVGEKRLNELISKPQLFKPVLDGDARVFKHDHTQASAANVLRHLIVKMPQTLLIQREMVDEGMEVLQTTAGQELQREIVEQIEKHEREVEELLKEMEASPDASARAELEEECRVLRERMIHLQTESSKLAGIREVDEQESLVAGVSSVAFTPEPSTLGPPLPPRPAVTFAQLTDGFPSSHRPSPIRRHSVATTPGDENRVTLEARVEQIQEELRAINIRLDEDRQRKDEDRTRLDDLERQLGIVLTLRGWVIGKLNTIAMVLGQIRARRS